MEVQGVPEGRAPRAITFRSFFTKDTQAEPNALQCNRSSASGVRKRRGRDYTDLGGEQPRAGCLGWKSGLSNKTKTNPDIKAEECESLFKVSGPF